MFIWMVRGKNRGSSQVARTGVTICSDNSGTIIPCAGTGQDGDLQEGVEWPADRFTIIYGDAAGLCADQGQDCDANPSTDAVLDKLTNRMWSRDAGLVDTSGINWQGALTKVQALNAAGGLCGYTDWRIPNKNEAFSLFDYAQFSPALAIDHPFVNVISYNHYWTSTSNDNIHNLSRTIQLWTGDVGNAGKSDSYGYYWPVRTANAGPDLHTLLSISANPVQTGSPLPYTITITNDGPGAATDVALTDTLPSGVVYSSYTASQGSCEFNGGIFTCNLGEIAQNGTATVTLNTTAPVAPGPVVNSSTVTTSSADPNLTNNQTDISVRVSDTFYTLTVLKDGTGDGTVSGTGVDCGTVCTPAVFEQSRITLAAAPDGQSAFYGWSGSGCTGKGACEILMDGNKTVTAVFNRTVGSVMLPKTGVTTSYAPGDDGALRRGAAWPEPRFTVIYGDVTAPCADQSADCDVATNTDVVLDNLTGLMWFRDGNCFNWGTNGSTLSFIVSIINNTFNAPNSGGSPCGYHDWRLPNINEMASLLNPGQDPAWLNSQGFVNIRNRYWTSTTWVDSPSEGWYVSLDGLTYRTGKTAGSVRPFFMLVRDTAIEPVCQLMRTGQTICYSDSGTVIACTGTGQDGEFQKGVAAPDPRFANPDGSTPASQDVVLDRLTHLMWTRNANLLGGTWQDALDCVAGMNTGSGYGGYTDWRLPNLFELRSLQNYSRSTPALPLDHPFENLVLNIIHWTSDTFHGYPTEAWTVALNGGLGGAFGLNSKTDTRWVWVVRGGAPNAAPGDLNLDGSIDLTDAIIALQVMSGISTPSHPQMNYADSNQDGRVGLPEAIYVLQEVAGLR